MIIYNTNISKNKTTYNSNDILEPKPQLKRLVKQKNLTKANKNFLESLNLKLKRK